MYLRQLLNKSLFIAHWRIRYHERKILYENKFACLIDYFKLNMIIMSEVKKEFFSGVLAESYNPLLSAAEMWVNFEHCNKDLHIERDYLILSASYNWGKQYPEL